MQIIIKRQRYKIWAAIFGWAIFTIAPTASALTVSDLPIPTQVSGLEEQISTDISPEIPKPGDKVEITLSAFGTDLNAANISWSVNGSVVKQGKGQKSLSTIVGKAGSVTTIVARIAPLYGNVIIKTFTINPATVDLIWEARTYTPPFYRGKAFYTPQENVVFVAMPNLTSSGGAVTNPAAVTYKWVQDTQVVGDRSGYGVNAFNYKGQILSLPVLVDVVASDANGLNAESFISLSPASPVAGLYEDSSLYGILWNNELASGFDFGNKEERSVAAIPYFFGVSSRSDANLAYAWAINGIKISVPQSQNEMTFRNTDGKEGVSSIGLGIVNNANFLENATGGTFINFKKPARILPI